MTEAELRHSYKSFLFLPLQVLVKMGKLLHFLFFLDEVGLDSLFKCLALAIDEWQVPGEIEVLEYLLGSLHVAEDLDEYLDLAFHLILLYLEAYVL